MRYLYIAGFVLCLSLSSCQTTKPASLGIVHNYIKTELFFGLNKPDGGAVSDAEWQDFVSKQVAPFFGEGFTIYQTEGRWQDTQTGQTIAEPSRVIVLIYPESRQKEQAIVQIVNTYKVQFAQQAVMRLDYTVKVSF